MRLYFMAAAILLLALPAHASPQTLCGWIDNPTPGNWWLTDAKQEWTISTQGGDQADSMDAIPDLSGKEWVPTNSHYGFGCACITAITNAEEGTITRVISAKQLPLSRCKNDPALPQDEWR